MQLHTPEMIHHLEKRTILIATQEGPREAASDDPGRRPLARRIVSLAQNAQKFVFDSGSDDARDADPVKETSLEMMKGGLFHLPFPEVVIEDPYDGDHGTAKNIYILREAEGQLVLFLIQRIGRNNEPVGKGPAAYLLFPTPMIMSLDEASGRFDYFGLAGDRSIWAFRYQEALSSAAYSIQKFIVFLATRNHTRVDLNGRASRVSKSALHRRFSYTIIGAPYDPTVPAEGVKSTPRKHLVRGYLRRASKSSEEKIWVAPYFRGSQEVGEAERRAYRVGSQ